MVIKNIFPGLFSGPFLGLFLGSLLFYSCQASAGWFDFFQDAMETIPEETKSEIINTGNISEETLKNVLSNEDITNGLKQALNKGVTYAVDNLGKVGGFANNTDVRIPMPENLKKVEDMLRTAGQDKYADEFVATMNQAAEQAVPLTLEVLKDSVQKITFEDAKKILDGTDTAATDYLRKTGSESMKEKISPIIKDATAKTGTTRIYKEMYEKLGFMGKFLNPDDYDIDTYITEQTMDGLFDMIAKEEQKIRENPVERTTDLLKDVFGSIKKSSI